MGGTIYYIDSSAPDGGNGLSPDTPWNTLTQINSHPGFLPDDQLLFKRGSVFTGITLMPKGSGVEGHPIIMDSYGEGPLPILDRQGEFIPGKANGSSTLILTNQSWWALRNLQISNHNPTAPGTIEDIHITATSAEFPIRHGAMIQANYSATACKRIVRGIVFENVLFAGIDTSHGDEGNCFVSRVNPYLSAGSGGGALCFRANDQSGGECRSYIDGITVENCTFRNIGGTAIGAQSGWTYYDSFSNVVVCSNRICNDPEPPLWSPQSLLFWKFFLLPPYFWS